MTQIDLPLVGAARLPPEPKPEAGEPRFRSRSRAISSKKRLVEWVRPLTRVAPSTRKRETRQAREGATVARKGVAGPLPFQRLTRAVRVLTFAVLGASAIALATWALVTLTSRPLDGVEGEVLFEAGRIRRGLPLYVDPLVGTADVPPSRYFVLYPPAWSALLALVPVAAPSALAALARVVALSSFVGASVVAASVGGRARGPALLALGFALSFSATMLFGAAARPDAFALFVATLALARVLRRGALDALAGAAFALAIFVKPNVMGLALGVFGATLVTRPRAIVGPALAGLAVGALGATVLQSVSGGAFIDHLLRSTAQGLSLSLWGEQLALRLPFVAVPFALALAYARPVRDAAPVVLARGALVMSVAWALFSLAKIGSASNYWMEPAVAAVALVSVAARERAARPNASALDPSAVARAALVAGVLLFAQSIHNGVAAVRNAIEGVSKARAADAAIAEVRAACIRAPGDVVVADEPGVEVELQGRLLGTPFQMAHLFAAGRLPREPFLADLARPEVRCVVAQRSELDDAEPWPLVHRRFDPEVRAAIRTHFVRDASLSAGGLSVWRRRGS